METEKTSQNGEWINNMKKELKELEEGAEANIYPDSLSERLKKVLNWKMLDHCGIHGFWF